MTMPDVDSLHSHYTRPGLLEAIDRGIEALGLSPERVTVDALAPVDEFHVGGREATRALLAQLALAAGSRVLDIGCGIGGAARFAASELGCTVVGLDLTAAYVDVGNTLCARTGYADRVSLVCRDAADNGYQDGHFAAAYMLHVGMNVADKAALFAEVLRVLERNGGFAIYDLMRTAEGDLTFPLPWASDPSDSALSAPGHYRKALERAGFVVERERNRWEFALDAARRMQRRIAQTGGPPPLGLHLLMGPEAPVKYANMLAAIEAGILAPVEMLARKP